jgi:hypothetical protein
MSHRFTPSLSGKRNLWEEAADSLVELDYEHDLPDFDLEARVACDQLGLLQSNRFQACCASGHIQDFSRAEMLSIFGPGLVLDIESGAAITRPILPPGECYHCAVEHQRHDRMATAA